MRCVWVRMTALLLTAFLTVAAAGTPARAAQSGKSTQQVEDDSRGRAQNAMFTVLGLAFVCAGGMVALIVAKDRT